MKGSPPPLGLGGLGGIPLGGGLSVPGPGTLYILIYIYIL